MTGRRSHWPAPPLASGAGVPAGLELRVPLRTDLPNPPGSPHIPGVT